MSAAQHPPGGESSPASLGACPRVSPATHPLSVSPGAYFRALQCLNHVSSQKFPVLLTALHHLTLPSPFHLKINIYKAWGLMTGPEVGNEALQPSLKSTSSKVTARDTKSLSQRMVQARAHEAGSASNWDVLLTCSKSSTVQTSTPREALGPNWESGTTERERGVGIYF